MRRWIRFIYRRLPIIGELREQARELCDINQSLARIEAHLAELPAGLRVLQTAAMVQALEAIKDTDERYRDPQRLLVHGAQCWSQNYEDGMIAEIFRRVPPVSKTFLEIGVGDGSENNTTALLAQGWRGWWIDGDPQCCASIRARLELMPALASRLSLREALVSPLNISDLLRELDVPTEVDFFSLDIDLDTYHIWAALKEFRPRVVVVEYNAAIPPSQSWIHPWEPNRVWDYTQAFGASLKAFEDLGTQRGYSLVACDLLGINAFFVRNDLVSDHFAAPFTAENHYEPPRYGLYYRWAHRSRFFGESQNAHRFQFNRTQTELISR